MVPMIRWNTRSLAFVALLAGVHAACGQGRHVPLQGPAAPEAGATPRGGPAPHFKREPTILTIAEIAPNFQYAAITDIEATDFDRDGMTDLAVAWYTTDNDSPALDIRALTIFYGSGTGAFARAPDINLYYYNAANPSLSIFRNGTAELAVGDFDGDGDLDIAA